MNVKEPAESEGSLIIIFCVKAGPLPMHLYRLQVRNAWILKDAYHILLMPDIQDEDKATLTLGHGYSDLYKDCLV